jgi:hypothetical protein
MRDLSYVANLITIAERVRKMGYSPGYLKVALESTDEEHSMLLMVLEDFDLIARIRTYDVFGVHTGWEIEWALDES